jgi:hypothetical protein
MTVWSWEQIGGTLIEAFPIVPKTRTQGERVLDGVIVLGEKRERIPVGARVDLNDRDLIVVQTKNSRLGMSLMGQALFSAQRAKRHYKPRRIQSVGLSAGTDAVLQPMLGVHAGCKAVECPAEVCRLTTRGTRRGTAGIESRRLARRQPARRPSRSPWRVQTSAAARSPDMEGPPLGFSSFTIVMPMVSMKTEQ